MPPNKGMELTGKSDTPFGKRRAKGAPPLNRNVSEIARFDRDELETEDAEQLAGNFERIMDCIGLESSNGILNTWMYGFDPSKQ